MVDITLHGQLGKAIGETWKLDVKSVSEAIRAIQVLSQRKLFKFLCDNDKLGIGYHVVINGDRFEADGEQLKPDQVDRIRDSELCIPRGNLETIDIVPVIQGSDEGILGIVLGAVLVVVGIVLLAIPGFNILGGALIIGGIGLIATGITNLLASPPDFEDFREVGGGGRVSYLFNGPQNVTREGGPVPVGYGRLFVGSQVIEATFEIQDIDADETNVDNPEIAEFDESSV